MSCLTFFKEHYMDRFSELRTRNDVARILNVSRKELTYVLYIRKPDNYYYEFEIPKKSGGVRCISAPSGGLKYIQKKLAKYLYDYQRQIWKEKQITPHISHGFEKGRDITTNAIIHKNKRYVLNLDLESFFDSFHFGRVMGFFEKNNNFKASHDVAVIIAQLACYNGKLPQGSPCSPVITNLICQSLDMCLLRVARRYRLDYTRYVDDLTFSTNRKDFLDCYPNFLYEVKQEIGRNGFKINDSKTRIAYKDSQQKVTGLVVNRKVNIDRNYYKKTRAMAHKLYKTGEFVIDGKPGSIKQLEGRFAFIDRITKLNNKREGNNSNCHNFCNREAQYQKFLFYKYFFANEKPLIVTEGPTDILYIKAALMKYYKEYPELIEKDENKGLEYKISFLRRTKRLHHFLGMSVDGASAMKTLYDYFIKGHNVPNYLFELEQLSQKRMNMPVILLFDNETITDRPLKDFLNHIKIKPEERQEFINKLAVSLIKDEKLYLMTIPLPNGKDECEMEDLFPKHVLNHEISGKKFCRDSKHDTETTYGKKIFAEYVFSNYEDIDFSQYKPLLDNIRSVISNN